jgi:hypothetical protein
VQDDTTFYASYQAKQAPSFLLSNKTKGNKENDFTDAANERSYLFLSSHRSQRDDSVRSFLFVLKQHIGL